MEALRIEICNERFLPRFGVDRLLVLLAQRLSQSGHDVMFTALRSDRPMLERIGSEIYDVKVPPDLDMAGTEAAVMNLVASRWRRSPPNIVVIGGWPFFEAAARAQTFGIKSIFIDAGAVAQEGMSASYLPVQLELRRIRQVTLPLIDRVLPISDFIRLSQSESDRGSDVGVRTVLLGADHMTLGTFRGDEGDKPEQVLRRTETLAAEGQRLVLLLGRFEVGGYKNSAASYDVLRNVRRHVPEARMLLLDAGVNCGVPADLAPFVELLGAPDDETLQRIMERCSAGVSLSTWEGFNLPLAEMQWVGRPALAFNIGSHPEVIADPWLLCNDVNEMSQKLTHLLQGKVSVDLATSFTAFRERRQWEITLGAWEDEIVSLASQTDISLPESGRRKRRVVLVDVTNASLDPANPGVIRVARRLCSQLQQHPTVELVLAAWHSQRKDYVFLDQTRRGFLERCGGPKDGLGILATCGRELRVRDFVAAIGIGRAQGPVLLMPEVMLDGQPLERVKWAKENGYTSAAILYDLIPVLHRELCGAAVTTGFPPYLEALSQVDAVWTISHSTHDDFVRFMQQEGHSMPPKLEAINLPGQFGAESRRNGSGRNSKDEVRILCVSTLEPRKNHLRLLEAFQGLRQQRPELPLRLVLVGNRYAGAPEIAERVQTASKRDSSIEWCGVVDDARLAREFINATFTVYPSLVEGYGLPILESLWMGRPCLTHNRGVMLELAQAGGCVTADMSDVEAIKRELERLATDRELRLQLGREAADRHIQTWEEYGSEIAERLANL